MRLIITLVFVFLFFVGCSFKSEQNQWEYNSSSAFNSYTKYFLIDEKELAKSDLQRAVKYAKQSADLEQLARVYLGVCALSISVGEDTGCNKYIEIQEFVSSKKLDVYFSMLVKKEEEKQIKLLPKQYQKFVKYKFLNKYDLAFEKIKFMEQSTSQFIAASLIKDEINKLQVDFLIKKASFLGYKKIVLFWLNHKYNLESNLEKKERIARKIKILEL